MSNSPGTDDGCRSSNCRTCLVLMGLELAEGNPGLSYKATKGGITLNKNIENGRFYQQRITCIIVGNNLHRYSIIRSLR